MPQRFERLQQGLHVGPAGAVKVLGDLLDGEGLVRVGRDGADGLSLGLEAGRPVERLRGGAVSTDVEVEIHLGLCLDRLGGLVRGAEVADVALFFLGPPLGVEGDEPLQNRLLRQPRVPAVRVGDGGVQVVVQFTEDADEALLMDRALRFVQVLAGPLWPS